MLFTTNPIRFLLKQNSKIFFVRHCGTKNRISDDDNQNQSVKSVRVRFAPSPTGNIIYIVLSLVELDLKT